MREDELKGEEIEKKGDRFCFGQLQFRKGEIFTSQHKQYTQGHECTNYAACTC